MGGALRKGTLRALGATIGGSLGLFVLWIAGGLCRIWLTLFPCFRLCPQANQRSP